jgi:hypothetical protein
MFAALRDWVCWLEQCGNNSGLTQGKGSVSQYEFGTTNISTVS